MPHDAKGNALKVGDRVLVPFIIKDLFGDSGSCNVNLESVLVMPDGGYTTTLSAINTKQVYLEIPTAESQQA